MKAVSLDIETLDTRSSGVILSIGACVVEDGKVDMANAFHERLDIEEQLAMGRTVSEGTLRFWMTQNDQARYAAMGEKGRAVVSVYDQLHSWWMAHGAPSVYVKGPQFDAAFISSLADDMSMEHPIHYRKWRDIRTLEELIEWSGKGGFVQILAENTYSTELAHNALQDARMQGELIALSMTLCAGDGPVKVGA